MRAIASSERQPKAPLRKRDAKAHVAFPAALLILAGVFRVSAGVRDVEFQRFAAEGTALDHAVQQCVRDAPLLLATEQRDRFVVEPDDPAVPFLLVSIEEADDITDRHSVASESLHWLFANLDIGAVKIDGGVGNQPAFLCDEVKHHRLLATQLQYLALMGAIGLRIEILDGLATTKSGPDRIHPSGLVQDTINGGPQTIQFEGGCVVEGGEDGREVHEYQP